MANPLFTTLVKLRGNPRACVYTEPLWGLSMNLCLPYMSVYMLALGLNDAQVGLVASIYMVSQVFFAFFSGPVIDKMGRRFSTAFWDFIAWSIPCIIWWRAESFLFFAIAAILNGSMRVTTNSWNCLLIEDAEKEHVTSIYSLVIICGQFSAFFAPIASILVSRLTLVPAIRILFINAFVLMTLKVFVLYFISKETRVGLVRLEESRGKNIFQLAGGYGAVIKLMLRSRPTIFAVIILILISIVALINTTFWQVIVSRKLLVPDPLLPLFPIIRSVLSIFFLFFIMPRLKSNILKNPFLLGFACYIIGQVILILVPVEGTAKYILLSISLIFDGFGFGALTTLSESLLALNVSARERARVMAIVHMVAMAVTSPFGWIGGLLSEMSRDFPFVLNIGLLVLGIAVILVYYNKKSINENESTGKIIR